MIHMRHVSVTMVWRTRDLPSAAVALDDEFQLPPDSRWTWILENPEGVSGSSTQSRTWRKAVPLPWTSIWVHLQCSGSCTWYSNILPTWGYLGRMPHIKSIQNTIFLQYSRLRLLGEGCPMSLALWILFSLETSLFYNHIDGFISSSSQLTLLHCFDPPTLLLSLFHSGVELLLAALQAPFLGLRFSGKGRAIRKKHLLVW